MERLKKIWILGKNGINIVGPSALGGPKENIVNFATQPDGAAIQDLRKLFLEGKWSWGVKL